MGRPSLQQKRTCARCDKTFMFRASQEKHYTNAGQFCSPECAHNFSYTCLGCGKKRDDGYVAHQQYCDKKCQYAARAKDPIRKKAFTMSSFITFGGKGKLDYFDALLRKTLGTNCPYCSTTLDLKNVSLDHIVPFTTSSARKNLLIKKQMDRVENLQIICRPCNQMKGNLSHDKFVKLLSFLDTDPELRAYVVKKLRQSSIMFTHSRNTR